MRKRLEIRQRRTHSLRLKPERKSRDAGFAWDGKACYGLHEERERKPKGKAKEEKGQNEPDDFFSPVSWPLSSPPCPRSGTAWQSREWEARGLINAYTLSSVESAMQSLKNTRKETCEFRKHETKRKPEIKATNLELSSISPQKSHPSFLKALPLHA